MIAEVPLFDDGPTAVAEVRAPDFALRDLALEVLDRTLPSGELDHTGSLGADVIEAQDHRIALAAVDARRVSKVFEEMEEVAAP